MFFIPHVLAEQKLRLQHGMQSPFGASLILYEFRTEGRTVKNPREYRQCHKFEGNLAEASVDGASRSCGGGGGFFFRGGGDLAEAAASAASVQFTAVTEHTNLFILAHRCVFST